MTETARLIDESAERLLSRRIADPIARRAPELPTQLWADFVESGLLMVLAPSSEGGFNGGMAEATALAWRIGWHAAPLPVVSSILGPALPSGQMILEGQAALARGTHFRLEASGSHFKLLTPSPVVVPDNGKLTSVLAICEGTKGPLIAHLGVEAAQAFCSLDGSPMLAILPGEIQVLRVEESPVPIDRAESAGSLIVAAAMVGAMARQIELSISYANTRQQFGRPIGKFQAIQHLIANAASEHVVAQAALSAAVYGKNSEASNPLLWQAAKVQAGRAATIVSAMAHQVFGAIGYTEEHELHLYSKRLWAWRDEWGHQGQLEISIGQGACRSPRLWDFMTEPVT